MTVRHEPWPEGRPAWADLMVPDRQQGKAFYQAIFGWDFSPESAPEMGYYTNALLGGETVAGMGEPLPGQDAVFQWTTYLATDDVAATVAKAQAHGATVIAPPIDVAEFGKMAILADPGGAVVGLWESGTHTGANRVDEPGTIVWSEQYSNDLEQSKGFYSAVFGYTFTDMSGEDFRYVTCELDGETVAGLGEIAESWMGEGTAVPPHWMTYFGVDSTDEALTLLQEKGGTALRGPWDTPFGRIAVVTGHAGEIFSIIAQSQRAPAES